MLGLRAEWWPRRRILPGKARTAGYHWLSWNRRPAMPLHCYIYHMISWAASSRQHTTKSWIQEILSWKLNQNKFFMSFVWSKSFKVELELYLRLYHPLLIVTHNSVALRSSYNTLIISGHFKYRQWPQDRKSTALSSRVSLTSTRWRSILTQFFPCLGKDSSGL